MNRSKPAYRAIKRIIDFLGSLFGLIILSPIFIVLAAAIYIDDGKPAIFRQDRIGKNKKPFTLYKFRTMEEGDDNEEDQSDEYNWDDRVPDDFVFKSSTSARVTKNGKLLRKYSLDELPQLFNVLKGEMSLVGPRPEIPEIVENYDEVQEQRLNVKPGITGLAQIKGRANLTHGEKMNYDLEYIKKRSLWLDVKIIVKTVINAINGEGAY